MNLLITAVLAVLVGSGWPGPAVRSAHALKISFPNGIAPATISGLTATPATVTFAATDPDLSPFGGTAATVTWSALLGLPTNTWMLSVQAGASAFSGDATVPVSAVTVTCSSASASGLGGTATCMGPFTLSTSSHVVASGAEGLLTGNYTVHIAFSFADSWKYVATPACTLTLTYTAVTP
jgi:hypothetical protein